jgi:chromodomain-helicase-DNA-binding protein 1
MPRDEKVAILKESLAAIGKRIEAVLQEKASKGEDTKRWKRHLWTFVTLFWPKKVKAGKLEELHTKMVTKEKESSSAPRAGSSEAVSKKPRLSSSAPSRPNGSSSHANGKYR